MLNRLLFAPNWVARHPVGQPFLWMWLILWPLLGWAQSAPETFLPPDRPPAFRAAAAGGKLVVNGRLDEPAWAAAEVIRGFKQQNPNQGAPASADTEVRVLFDERYLYVGAVCRDDLRNRNHVRVQNLRRDFDWDFNDNFGVVVDGFKDKRNAVSFQTTPRGNLRDLQVVDGTSFNRDWDALWYCRTQITDTAWIAEMAIPWKTLRYPENAQEIGIVFLRNIRRYNEFTVAPAIPRVFTPYRMAYEAVLTGIAPPKPSANVLVNPYLLAENNRRADGQGTINEFRPKVGGEVKWAVTPNTVLDATLNTDFAQADADRQVVNLQRFSVLFPERRQFFLENASIFRANVTDFILPFFSRRIGLDEAGNPIPLDGGLRLTSQTSRRSVGVLAMRQRATSQSPTTHFGVLRYSQNLGAQSRLGGMATYRHDALPSAQQNFTATVDGVFRPSQKFNVQGMVSTSRDARAGNGLASQLWASYATNFIYVGWIGYYVRNYQPGLGLERFGRDYFYNSPAIDFDLRPKWLPKKVRRLLPVVYAGLFHTPDLRDLISGNLGMVPLSLEFQNGATAKYTLLANWQKLDATEQLVGVTIAPGYYQYLSQSAELATDFSAKLAGRLTYTWGGYFNGSLQTLATTVRFAPVPFAEFSADYEFNRISRLGTERRQLNTHLLGLNTRLALNPRVQLIGFYQWNSSLNRDLWNVRLSWEYRPLSFLYVVFNSNRVSGPNPRERVVQQQGIAKLTYLKLF
jgi:hypothetical protein